MSSLASNQEPGFVCTFVILIGICLDENHSSREPVISCRKCSCCTADNRQLCQEGLAFYGYSKSLSYDGS